MILAGAHAGGRTQATTRAHAAPIAEFDPRLAIDVPCPSQVIGTEVQPFDWSAWKSHCVHTQAVRHRICFHAQTFGNGCDETECEERQHWFQIIERVMLERWRTSSFACSKHSAGCSTGVHSLVVPSVWAHCNNGDPDAYFNDLLLDTNRSAHLHFWRILRHRVATDQVVVVHTQDSLDVGYNLALMHSLAEQPAAFVRRVVLVTGENPFQLNGASMHQLFVRLGATPSVVVVPVPVLSVAPGFIDASSEHRVRPFAILYEGRLNLGRRKQVHHVLLQAGAICREINGGGVTCAVCANGVSADVCQTLHHQLSSADSQASTTLAMAASSTFCLQPQSDTLVRSHLYVSILTGCIPVIFDGFAWPDGEPTEWAWRNSGVLHGIDQLSFAHGAKWPSLSSIVNYSRFALIYSCEYNEYPTHCSYNKLTNTSGQRLMTLVRDLMSWAGSDAVLQHSSMVYGKQRALAQVAPLMRYATSSEPCSQMLDSILGGLLPPCDAFSMFALVLYAAHHRIFRSFVAKERTKVKG